MNRRKPTAALLIAILLVLALSALSQLPDEIVGMSGVLTLTYRGVAMVLFIIVCGGAAAAIAFWPAAGVPAPPKVEATQPPSEEQSDEMLNFAREINRQLVAKNQAHVAALEQIRHTDRLTTVGHLAAGIAHELGTPLSVMSGRAELIATADMPREKVVHSAGVIVEQADRMTVMIRQLLDFSRRGAGKRSAVDLRQVVRTTADLISGIANKAKVEIVCDLGDEAVPVHLDSNTMQQALTNIALNGIQAMPNGGRLRMSIATRQLQPPAGVSVPPGTYHCVLIEDTGVGIQPEHLSEVFEPFFTTKGIGEGTGLGLPVAHGIVAEHGGWISVESVAGRGSRFSLMVPRGAATAGHNEEAA